LFVKPPKIIRLFYPNLIWKKKESTKKLWLTFDDGPDPQATPWILTILNNLKIKATFFLVGEQMEKFPETVNAIKDSGHLIANHSYSHNNGWTTKNSTYFEDIKKCQALMPENKLYRPPYGKISITQIYKLKKKYKLILWDVLSMDFSDCSTPSKIKKNVLNNVENGSIIVFHNNKKSLTKLKQSLKETISELKEKGYAFSTTW